MVYGVDYFMSWDVAHSVARRKATGSGVRYRVRPIRDPGLPWLLAFQVLPSAVAEPCS